MGHLAGARGPIKWVQTHLGPDKNPLGTNGKAVVQFWANFYSKTGSKNCKMEKNSFSKMAIKWARQGVKAIMAPI